MITNKLSTILQENPMLDAHQLNIFLVASDTLNFTQAAERLHMSQPSVSQHIRALEKHFDELLFIRQGRSLILSDAGRVLIPMARQFVTQSTRINEAMSSLKGHIKGQISISCNALTGRYTLPEIFTQFHEMYPEVNIACQTINCGVPLDSLRSGDMHFLFTNQDSVVEPCYQAQFLLEDEIMLITPKDHRWAKRENIEVEELLEEKYILPSTNTLTYMKVNEALASKNQSLMQLDSFLTLDNPEAIALSVDKGLGLSFSSTTISSRISKTVSVPIKDIEIKQSMYIVKDKTQLTTAAREAFWEFVNSASANIQEKTRIK